MSLRPAVLLTALAVLAAPARAAEPEDPLRPALEAAVKRVVPSLVRIEVVWTDYSQGRAVKHEVGGSGFIVDPRGYVVTNHHVAGHAARASCIFSDNEEVDAELVGADPMTDIAVLRLLGPKGKAYPAVAWGDSDAARVGDAVLAMGSPLALSQSVTRGIVSNTKMTMPRAFGQDEELKMDGEDVGALVRWLGHDAPIYPGNSGGPLVDLSGRVIGVNEISYGLAGAIPSALARTVSARIIADGKVRRSWLGLEAQPLLKGATPPRGVLISGVISGSPAERAGVKSDDVLLALNGREVTVRYDEEMPPLNLLVADLPIGSAVEARLLRGGRERTVSITTAEREATDPRQSELKEWGMTARDVSLMTSLEMRLRGREGALVATVRPGGPCGDAKPPLQPDDVVRSVAGKPVKDVAALVALTRELAPKDKGPVPLLVGFDRDGESFLTVVRVGIRDDDDRSVEAHKAWLPVAVQAITRELAARLGDPAMTGVRVTRVYPRGTAEKAGLEMGDLITAIDGEAIPASQSGDEEVFFAHLRQRRPGDKPAFTVRRGAKTVTVSAELVRSPAADREMERYKDRDFEFSARDLGFFDRVQRELPDDAKGALVTAVEPGGWAALGGLRGNDIILAVEGKAVAGADELGARMKDLARDRAKTVVLQVLRGIHRRAIQLEPSWNGTGKSKEGGR